MANATTQQAVLNAEQTRIKKYCDSISANPKSTLFEKVARDILVKSDYGQKVMRIPAGQRIGNQGLETILKEVKKIFDENEVEVGEIWRDDVKALDLYIPPKRMGALGHYQILKEQASLSLVQRAVKALLYETRFGYWNLPFKLIKFDTVVARDDLIAIVPDIDKYLKADNLGSLSYDEGKGEFFYQNPDVKKAQGLNYHLL